MSITLHAFWHKVFVLFFLVLAALFILSGLAPGKAFAATVAVNTATSSSNNASTTLAKVGNVVSFQLNLNGTPSSTSTPVISVLNLGTTSMSGSGGSWTFSTSSASGWTEGNVTFTMAWGGSLGEATTTFKSSASTTVQHVRFDNTNPTGYSASISDYVNSANSTAASFTLSSVEVYATYLFEIGTGSASTTGSGIITTTSYDVTGINLSSLLDGALTLNVSTTDAAGNKGATTTDTTILDTSSPSDPTASPGANGYTSAQSVTLSSTGSDSIRYNSGPEAADVSSPTCSSGTVYSSAITVSERQTIKAIGCDTAGNTSSVVTLSYGIVTGSTGGSSGGGSKSKSSPSALTTSSGITEAQVQSILSLLAAFDASQSIIDNVKASLHGQASSGGGSAPTSCTFSRDLTIGSTGADVTCLQQKLISLSFSIPAGATGYFGDQTRAAVASWQASRNIAPAVGYFGAISRAAILAM